MGFEYFVAFCSGSIDIMVGSNSQSSPGTTYGLTDIITVRIIVLYVIKFETDSEVFHQKLSVWMVTADIFGKKPAEDRICPQHFLVSDEIR